MIEEGKTITLMNAHVKVVSGFIKIELDKWAMVKPAATEDELKCDVNTANNLSDVEYELVSTKDPDTPTPNAEQHSDDDTPKEFH